MLLFFVNNFEDISDFFLVFLLLTLNRQILAGYRLVLAQVLPGFFGTLRDLTKTLKGLIKFERKMTKLKFTY